MTNELTDADMMTLIQRLIDAGRLVATLDVDGEPFHCVTVITQRRKGNQFILWLDPTRLDDDLRSVMPPPEAA